MSAAAYKHLRFDVLNRITVKRLVQSKTIQMEDRHLFLRNATVKILTIASDEKGMERMI